MNGVRIHFMFSLLRRPRWYFCISYLPNWIRRGSFPSALGWETDWGEGCGGCMSSIKMNGELVPLSKEVLFPSDKSETALVDMQRGQWRLCARRKPPIYEQTLLHITLTTSQEKTELGESQPQAPSRRCRKHRKSKASQILPDLSVYTWCCEAAWLAFFFPVFRPPDGCCWILWSTSPPRMRSFCSFAHLEQFVHSREQIQGLPPWGVMAISASSLHN